MRLKVRCRVFRVDAGLELSVSRQYLCDDAVIDVFEYPAHFKRGGTRPLGIPVTYANFRLVNPAWKLLQVYQELPFLIIMTMITESDTTTPLLTPEEASERNNGGPIQDEEPKARMREELLRVGAMLGMVLVGLAVVLLIFFWPLIFGSLLPTPNRSIAVVIGYRIGIQVVHVLLLVYLPFPYLYLHRKLCLPIRTLLMPLVNEVSKSEGIREREDTWYNKCSDLPQTRDPSVLLSQLKPSCRKDLKKKLKLFFEQEIQTQTVHSDFLSLRVDIPILWAHEKRAVEGTDKSVVEEFIKRILVLFLVAHAYLDRYYDKDGKICALGQFVSCGNTINNFMYFCLEEQSRSGIWQCKSID